MNNTHALSLSVCHTCEALVVAWLFGSAAENMELSLPFGHPVSHTMSQQLCQGSLCTQDLGFRVTELKYIAL